MCEISQHPAIRYTNILFFYYYITLQAREIRLFNTFFFVETDLQIPWGDMVTEMFMEPPCAVLKQLVYLSIYDAKMPNILWFQFLKYEVVFTLL